MRATGLRRFPFVALVVLAAACGDERSVVCAELDAQLESCDLPPASYGCESLVTSQAEVLLERFESSSCAAINAEGGPRPDRETCDMLGWPCPDSLFGAAERGSTRFPIVFVSGISDQPLFDWNPRILEAVREIGPNEVHIVRLAPFGTRVERARDLWNGLITAVDGRDTQVNLVCYAVGGLDCRYLLSPNGYFAEQPELQSLASRLVATLTTVSTPHRGTEVADAVGKAAERGSTDLVDEFLGGDYRLPELEGPDDGALVEVLDELTPASTFTFNRRVVDDPNTVYLSWAGVSHIFGQPLVPSEDEIRAHCRGAAGQLLYARHPGTYDVMNEVLWATAPFARDSLDAEGHTISSPTDGMVSVASAKWGNFRGCIPADHYDVIGQVGDLGLDPNTGFDAAQFYEHVAADLARQGF